MDIPDNYETIFEGMVDSINKDRNVYMPYNEQRRELVMPEETETPKQKVVIELPDAEGGKVVYVVQPDNNSGPSNIIQVQPQPPAVDGWKHGFAKLAISLIIGAIVEQGVEQGYNAAVRKIRSRKGR